MPVDENIGFVLECCYASLLDERNGGGKQDKWPEVRGLFC